MSGKPITLYDDGQHKCLMFGDLVTGDGIQSNQFLIIHGKRSALIDPGGDLTYMPLTLAASRHIKLKQLDYVLASHQDPDIIAALDRWLLNTNAQVVVSELWSRFLPHLSSSFLKSNMGVDPYQRMITLPDRGMDIPFGDTVIKAIPAHFLHSVGNFQFYDPVSKILFSGDMGASAAELTLGEPVSDFRAHIPHMEGFHRRYMCSRKVCALWANMVRELDIDMLVPQHGGHFQGSESIESFLDWISQLDCGVDLMTQQNYLIPHA